MGHVASCPAVATLDKNKTLLGARSKPEPKPEPEAEPTREPQVEPKPAYGLENKPAERKIVSRKRKEPEARAKHE